MVFRNYVKFVLCVISVIGWTCASDNLDRDHEKVIDTIISPVESDQMEMSGEAIENIIQSIPSPLEMTTIIKESGASFFKKMLNETDNVDNYATGFKKAINLGIYGVDLGYINIYEKTHLAFDYLGVVKTLSNELKVGQFFDFSTLKRLAGNSKNIDSILYISTSGFERMNNYLNERQRGNISILILVGGWIESLYIATRATNVDIIDKHLNANRKLKERIGEQKIVLDDIMLLLTVYKNIPGFNTLINDLEELREIYKDVKITYTYEEPEMQEVDGMLIVVDKSTSTVEMNPEQRKQIMIKVNSIRNNIIN